MTDRPHRPRLELWGGIECTFNRVGDRYFDQLAWSGHRERLSDLDLIAGLGIRTLRYPVIWEQIAPDGLDTADWRWTDRALHRLSELGITPVVTLVHHGSGPRHTHLLDPGFAEGLAAFAEAVARRYPWVTHYTPVNEPLTTARFSALYGHWYPHARDGRRFLAALLNEIDATVLAMRAVRRVTSNAQLVQTEDVGKTHSTPALAYQAEFENRRRWLTFDLLFGKVDRAHPLWGYLLWEGVPERLLDELASEPCPPDIVGVNSYITSERFIDDRLERYPAEVHGGNGRDRYADVEAVRAIDEIAGWEGILRETAERYPAPIAITEVHLGGHRSEQLRWLHEAWETVNRLHGNGLDIRALTVWALFGSHNWHRLVTVDLEHYEPGAFDVRTARPRATALATMIRHLANGRSFAHPALDSGGWWCRPERLLYAEGAASAPAVDRPAGPSLAFYAADRGTAEPLIDRARFHCLSTRFARWRGEPLAKLDAGDDWSAIVLVPELDGRTIVALLDLLEARPDRGLATVVAAVAGESEVRGLVDALAGRALIVDIGQGAAWAGAFADAVRALPPETRDEVIDLCLDRAVGLWRVTADGVLVPLPRRTAADRGARPPAPVAIGRNAELNERTLDGSWRIR